MEVTGKKVEKVSAQILPQLTTNLKLTEIFVVKVCPEKIDEILNTAVKLNLVFLKLSIRGNQYEIYFCGNACELLRDFVCVIYYKGGVFHYEICT